MRKSVYSALAAVIAMTAISCQKAEVDQISGTGERIVTCVFEGDATKTVLAEDGQTPVWAAGDVIRLLDEFTYEDITLTEEDIAQMKGDQISLIFKTTLEGWPLYAIYPASATDMKVGIDEQVAIKIPTAQDGSFEHANICVAMGDEDDMMVFRNATSVLKFTQAEAGVTGIKVEAENAIAGDCLVSFDEDGTLYNTMLKTGSSSSQITVASDKAQDVYYIAAAAKVTTGNTKLTFFSADGYATANKSSKDLKANTMYTLGNIDDMGLEFKAGRGFLNGHEFVQIGDQKWATENLYITESGKQTWLGSGYPRGDFFRWGETWTIYDEFKIENIPSNDNEGAYVFNTFHEDMEGCPPETFWNGWKSTNTSRADANGFLTKENDPVIKYWGGTWHMPNGGDKNDFKKLYSATYWAFDTDNYGCYVFEPDAKHPAGTIAVGLDGLNKQDALLYFPATGWALSTAVSNTGFMIKQWTNHYYPNYDGTKNVITSFQIIWDQDNDSIKKYYVPTDKIVFASKYGWWLGYNIRPVSE